MTRWLIWALATPATPIRASASKEVLIIFCLLRIVRIKRRSWSKRCARTLKFRAIFQTQILAPATECRQRRRTGIVAVHADRPVREFPRPFLRPVLRRAGDRRVCRRRRRGGAEAIAQSTRRAAGAARRRGRRHVGRPAARHDGARQGAWRRPRVLL